MAGVRSRAVGLWSVVAALWVAAPVAAQAQSAPQVPPGWEPGVNLTDWTPDGYGDAREALQAARNAGVTNVSLVPTLYVDDATDSTVAPDPDRTPTDDSLLQAATDAHALGLSVTIKPHVDVLDGTYRGDLRPADRAQWFATYDRWLGHYARLARTVGAERLVIATELDSLSGDLAAFSGLIATARGAFGGEVTYAANWNALDQVGFWDQLDVIGVDAYVPLMRPGTPEGDLRAAWAPLEARLADLHAQTGKPVIFTELGYQSRSDALASPFSASGAVDPGVQERGYEAAFAVWSRVPWFRGISWWDWHADNSGMSGDDRGFSPRGKPAEAVMREWTETSTAGAPGAGTGAGLVVALALAFLAGVAVVVGGRWHLRRRDRRPAVEHGGEEATAVLVEARATLDARTAVLFLRDPRDPRLAYVALGVGVPVAFVGSAHSSDQGLMGHVLITGNPIAVARYGELPAPIRHPLAPPIPAALSVPVRLDGVVVGAITVGRDEAFAPSERHLLTPLADRLAEALRPALSEWTAPAEGLRSAVDEGVSRRA